MDPRYSAEAEAYREKIQAFLAEHLPAGLGRARRARPEAQERPSSADWRRILAEHDLLAVAWPTEYGGAGLSLIERTVLPRSSTEAGLPTGGDNDGFSIRMIGHTLMQWGTESQKRHFLPRILSGEDVWCQGYSEPELGLRPGVAGDPGRARRRRVGDQRPEDLDQRRAHRQLDLRAVPHRPRRHQARGHLVPAVPDGPARHRGAADRQHRRRTTTSTRCSSPTPAPPPTNVVGGVDNGWAVANTLLGLRAGRRRHRGRHPPPAWSWSACVAVARDRGRIGDPLVRQRAGLGLLQGRDHALPRPADGDEARCPATRRARSRRSTSCTGPSYSPAPDRAGGRRHRRSTPPCLGAGRRSRRRRRRRRVARSARGLGDDVPRRPRRRRSTPARTRSSATSSASGSSACPRSRSRNGGWHGARHGEPERAT